LTALKTAATGIVADQLRLERNWRQGKARTGKNGEIKQKLNIDFSPQAAVQASPILAEYEKHLCSPQVRFRLSRFFTLDPRILLSADFPFSHVPQPVGLAPPALESYYQHDILFRIASKMCEIVSAPNELYRWTLPPADATWEKRRNTAFLFISFSYALVSLFVLVSWLRTPSFPVIALRFTVVFLLLVLPLTCFSFHFRFIRYYFELNQLQPTPSIRSLACLIEAVSLSPRNVSRGYSSTLNTLRSRNVGRTLNVRSLTNSFASALWRTTRTTTAVKKLRHRIWSSRRN